MKISKIDGIEEVNLVIRNVDGIDLLFTSDGKLLANQIKGFIYYLKEDGQPRHKTFRTAFFVDHKKVDLGGSLQNG